LKVEGVIEATRRWVAELVVGRTLCPFAAGLLEAELLSIRVAPQAEPEALLYLIADEAQRLAQLEPTQLETSLVVHPLALPEFEAQLDFLPAVEGVFEELGLQDELQVVSFHPDYYFQDASLDDAANYTNRSPFAMFHLLRRASVERAVAGHADPDSIWRDNVETLRELGAAALEARLVELRALAKA
jgi:hypothetical protein